MKLSELLTMLNLNYYKVHAPHPDAKLTKGIVYVKDRLAELDPRIIYIGTPDAILHCIKKNNFDPHNPHTFISSGSTPQLATYFNDNRFNLIISSLSLIEIYDQLNTIYRQITTTIYKFQNFAMEQKNPEQFTLLLKHSFYSCFFVLNSGFKVITSDTTLLRDPSVSFSSKAASICTNLLIEQYLPEHVIEYLMKQNNSFSQNNVYFRALRYQNDTVGYLLMFFPLNYRDDLALYIINCIRPYIAQALMLADSNYKKNASLHQLFDDLLNRKIATDKELKERLKLIHFSIEKLYSCMVIQTPTTSSLRFSYILSRITYLFPRNTVDYYHNYIIILIPSTQHASIPIIDTIPLSQFLAEYDCYAGIGFPMRSLLGLPAAFKASLNCIEIGLAMSGTKNSKRIFYQEDYYIYNIFHIIKYGSFNSYFNSQIGYLTHPAYIQLHRYDLEHNDNLSEVLYMYLINNQSVNRAADALYIHRNTLMNKIRKIEDIIHRSLQDALLCQSLLLSFEVVKYSREVLNEDIELQPK